MSFGNLGFMEIMIILVVVLLVFGAKRLPEIGSSMGKGIREFKKSFSDIDKEIREPVRESSFDRDRRSERIGATESTRQEEEERPEPKRLLS
jgi:sec-independent protein translocase protein TatA